MGLSSLSGRIGLGLAAAVAGGLSLTHGWGGDGHRIVCEIARREASPATRVAITEILRDDPARTFASSCTWADEVRSSAAHEHMRTWHYMDATGGDGLDVSRDCGQQGCAVSAVVHLVGDLRGARIESPLDRAGALKMLGHVVADLHQPLHAGHAADRGGNTIEVIYQGRPASLHRVWDTLILETADETWRQTAARLRRHPPPVDAADMDPMIWAEESHELARRHAYDLPRHARLGREWALEKLPVVEAGLARAGARLAHLLDRTIGVDPGARETDPPFWVVSRRGTTYHYPECAGAQRIVVRNLMTYARPPADRTLHRGCPD